MSQDETDQCWRSLAERMEDEVLDSTRLRTVKERPSKVEAPRWSGGVCVEARETGKSGEKIAG